MKLYLAIAAILLGGALLLADAFAAAAGEKTGPEIVKAKCASCHETGKHGAPKIGDRDAWVPRMKKGLDATVLAAIRGHDRMPARGGLAEVTDAELRAAVVHMFNPAGPPARPAPPAALPPNQRLVDGTKVLLGTKQLREGIYQVTITLRDARTDRVIDNAEVEVRVTNPVMGADAKKLTKSTTQGVVSYGNEFRVSGRESHAIQVEARVPGKPRPIETTFDFKG